MTCNPCKARKLMRYLERVRDVDTFTKETGAVASVFVREGDDFVRRSSTVPDEEGKSTVGIPLDRNTEVYKRLIRNLPFSGEAVVFGQKYYTKYKPFITENCGTRTVVAFGLGIII